MARTKMTPTKVGRTAAGAVAGGLVGLLMLAAPVSAQTYSNGGDNSTDQGTDDPTGGGNTPPTTVPAPDPTTPDNPGVDDPPGDTDPVAQVDDDLAFTGSDARSLAVIGAGIAGAGAFLVISTRRREEVVA